MPQQKSYTQTDAVQFLVVNHIDRISQGLTGLDPSQSNIDKITNFYLQTRILQGMLTLIYDEKYLSEKEKLGLLEAQKKIFLHPTMPNALEFFDKIADWFELLIICCNKNDILVIKKKPEHRKDPFTYDRE